MHLKTLRAGRLTAAALALVLTASCAAAPAPSAHSTGSTPARSAANCPPGAHHSLCVRSIAAARSDTAARAITYALRRVGHPYCNPLSPCGGDSNRFGHGPRQGFDCSGLVWRAYREAGIDLGAQTSGSQVTSGGPRRAVPVREARPGDIVGHRGHVAILLADGRIVEAPKPGVNVRVAGFAHRGFDRAATVLAR